MSKTEAITAEWLTENGYEILNFDPNFLVAFTCDGDAVEIYQKNMMDNEDGQFFTLLYDEVNTIHKAITNEY